MSEPLGPGMDGGLRAGLEAWEHEIATYWDSVTRSPDFLQQVSHQMNESLLAHRRANVSMQSAMLTAAAQEQEIARQLYLLERLEKQLDSLAARLERLEAALDDE